MSERKIRLTLSSTIINNLGALIDVDFNGENLDIDLEVTAVSGVSNLIKEYTVDATAGTHNLDIFFKNDVGDSSGDRNLIIEKIEISNDGINYSPFVVTEFNSNVKSTTEPYNFNEMGYVRKANPDFNPDLPVTDSNTRKLLNLEFDENVTRTDTYGTGSGYEEGGHPGSNSKFLYEFVINPITIFMSSTTTFQISFS